MGPRGIGWRVARDTIFLAHPLSHVLLCKTRSKGALRGCFRTSNMVTFSLGLVPAQAFRAKPFRGGAYGSENGNPILSKNFHSRTVVCFE